MTQCKHKVPACYCLICDETKPLEVKIEYLSKALLDEKVRADYNKSEAEKLREQRNELSAKYMRQKKLLKETNAEIELIKAEFRKYRDVVEWYARYAGTTEINHDYGQRAMKVLGLKLEDV